MEKAKNFLEKLKSLLKGEKFRKKEGVREKLEEMMDKTLGSQDLKEEKDKTVQNL